MPTLTLKKVLLVLAVLAVAGVAMAWALRHEMKIKADQARNYILIGDSKFNQGNLDDAIADYNKALELKPDVTLIEAAAYFGRGNAKSRKEDLDGAIADYNRAIELKPDIGDIYAMRGFAKGSKGDLDGAIADHNKALELGPDKLDGYNFRGSNKLIKGDFNGAMADYRKVIQMDAELPSRSDQEDSENLFAKIHLYLVLRHLQQDTAVTELEKSIKSAPDDFYSTVGHYVLGDLSEADLLGEAAKFDGATSKVQLCRAFYYIGLTHFLQNDPAGARDFFTKCVDSKVLDLVEFELAKVYLARLANSNQPTTPPPTAAPSPAPAQP